MAAAAAAAATGRLAAPPACRHQAAAYRPPAACRRLSAGRLRSGGCPCMQLHTPVTRAQNSSRPVDLEQLEIAVPADQRPVNELTAIKSAWLYSWATLPPADYVKRLAIMFVFFATLVGAPISGQTFEPSKQSLEFLLSSSLGSLVVVSIAALRIYLGWQYVGDRLLAAAVPYEETGWYDCQVFVKPPEVLARDRLLAAFEVRPVLTKVRRTLLAGAALLLATSVLLFGLITVAPEDAAYGGRPVPRLVTTDGVLYGKRVKDLSQLANDEELAAEEAEAQGGVPGYCGDRLLRALAGGQYCS